LFVFFFDGIIVGLDVSGGLGNSLVGKGVNFIIEGGEDVGVVVFVLSVDTVQSFQTSHQMVFKSLDSISGLGGGDEVEFVTFGELGEDFGDGGNEESFVGQLFHLSNFLKFFAGFFKVFGGGLDKAGEGGSTVSSALV